jgi:hypothetical protein
MDTPRQLSNIPICNQSAQSHFFLAAETLRPSGIVFSLSCQTKFPPPFHRVTRLGEFLTLGTFLKMTELAQIFRLLYYNVKFMNQFLTKMGWDKILAIISQTHLVTLSASSNGTPRLPFVYLFTFLMPRDRDAVQCQTLS